MRFCWILNLSVLELSYHPGYLGLLHTAWSLHLTSSWLSVCRFGLWFHFLLLSESSGPDCDLLQGRPICLFRLKNVATFMLHGTRWCTLRIHQFIWHPGQVVSDLMTWALVCKIIISSISLKDSHNQCQPARWGTPFGAEDLVSMEACLLIYLLELQVIQLSWSSGLDLIRRCHISSVQ